MVKTNVLRFTLRNGTVEYNLIHTTQLTQAFTHSHSITSKDRYEKIKDDLYSTLL